MEPTRPDPDALLKQAKEAERRGHRGHLKIFLGASPGVGKTFAMLTAARTLTARGVDVVVGLVETHGRSETEALTLGLDILPRRAIEYRGTTLQEFDLDAALTRAPEVLLVDELAHTNAPGSRHEKRWEDVRELLDAGISVYTTLNIQHIESLNDVVAQITGVRVQETVPDSVAESADEIELIDLPPDALLERLRQGKVYVPTMAHQAIQSFFRKGNLAALRELSLRRTAEWVERQVDEYKRERGITQVWASNERLMIALGPSPTSATLLRAAKRLAVSLRADLIAVHVETPASARMSAKSRERLMANLRLAESLGVETVTLQTPRGRSVGTELLEYARRRNVSKIVVGKPEPKRLLERLRGSPVDKLVRSEGEIDNFVVRGESGPSSESTLGWNPILSRRTKSTLGAYVRATLIIGVFVAIALPLYRPPDLATEALVCLLGVVLAAAICGRGPGVLASVLAVASLNFLFTEPRFSFAVRDFSDLITLGVMLIVGVVVGSLTATIREQSRVSRDREQRTASLYAMTRELAAARETAEIGRTVSEHVREVFDCSVAVLLSDGSGGLIPSAGDPAAMTLDAGALGVARWAFDHNRPAGLGTTTLPASSVVCLPLQTSHGRVGVICVRPHEAARTLTPSQRTHLETFASLAAQALERARLLGEAHTARIDAESERIRSAMLSSVSHDLRTPLAAIEGSAGVLRESEGRLDDATRADLADSIVTEAHRLNRLIGNLLFATRLESGAIDLRREWSSVEEIIGSAVDVARSALADHPLRLHVPEGLPLVRVDPALIEQVIVNLLENAARHTPPTTPVEVSTWREDDRLVIQVSDQGPGIAPGEERLIFQRFARGQRTGASGAGLGLAICEGIVRAHSGRIWAENAHPRGAAFKFSLPIEAQPAIPQDHPAHDTPHTNART